MKSILAAVGAVAVAVGLSACSTQAESLPKAPSVLAVPDGEYLTTQELARVIMPSIVVLRAGDEQGSGVAIGRDLIITNAHVVDGQRGGKAELYGGKQLPFTVVGASEGDDIALVRIAGANLTPITLCPKNRCELQAGDPVVAFGAPMDLDWTITSGIVSSATRAPLPRADAFGEDNTRLVQHDASIGPGSSGGALVNARGWLVGINTSVLSMPHGGGDIGFAIPAEDAITAAHKIIVQAAR